MLSRFAIYFDEVARRRSIRRASEFLNIAPSAVDRQILKMEDAMGVPLFHRLPQGLQLTAAGELLIDVVRRWRRELRQVEAQIDAIRGLRRGEITVALAEGSDEFALRGLLDFRKAYPGIVFRLTIAASQEIVDMVLRGEIDVGLTFNPPERRELRLERAMIYQVGAVMLPDHPLAEREKIRLSECTSYPMVGPDEEHSLRSVLNQAWNAHVGEPPRFVASANSVHLLKAMVLRGMGIGLLTPIDVMSEVEAGLLRYVPMEDGRIPLSVLSVITASGRPLSGPASLLVRHLGTQPVEGGMAVPE